MALHKGKRGGALARSFPRASVAGLAVVLVLLASCGRKRTVQLPPPAPAVLGAAEEGVASWYGHPYHGRRTSNGEVYDMEQMTAAHLRLPFHTWVRVTNLSNGRQVDVRINDRGPFKKKRIIDLSRAAAREIGMLGPGTARVRVEVVATPVMAYRPEPPPAIAEASAARRLSAAPSPPSQTNEPALPASGPACEEEPYFAVQVGAFRQPDNAKRLLSRVTGAGQPGSVIESARGQAVLFRVVVGNERDFQNAKALRSRLLRLGVDGFVTRVDPPHGPHCL